MPLSLAPLIVIGGYSSGCPCPDALRRAQIVAPIIRNGEFTRNIGLLASKPPAISLVLNSWPARTPKSSLNVVPESPTKRGLTGLFKPASPFPETLKV